MLSIIAGLLVLEGFAWLSLTLYTLLFSGSHWVRRVIQNIMSLGCAALCSLLFMGIVSIGEINVYYVVAYIVIHIFWIIERMYVWHKNRIGHERKSIMENH